MNYKELWQAAMRDFGPGIKTQRRATPPLSGRSGWPQPVSAEMPADIPWIGRQLGELFDDVLQEPLPDRFAELLRCLEARERDGGD
ncbi:MAG: NepR family anti-sigma factor [Tistlia sp.]|uniref:NepR family anti-sigma factor n=1 Tax=Tistlia sp. TaxID=3057121 RepID=UPI0034A58CA5